MMMGSPDAYSVLPVPRHSGASSNRTCLPVGKVQKKKTHYIYENNFSTTSSKYKVGEWAISF
jgi:hypothetical protein